MKQLIISNKEGKIITTQNEVQGELEDFDVSLVEVPEGKMLIGVNIETGEPIFADIPPSEIETLRGDLENAIVELSMLISTGGM